MFYLCAPHFIIQKKRRREQRKHKSNSVARIPSLALASGKIARRAHIPSQQPQRVKTLRFCFAARELKEFPNTTTWAVAADEEEEIII
jgi:hypothetical protein